MHAWNDTALMERDTPLTTPPVDELLLVYLGQSCGSRAPEPVCHYARTDAAQDLWDYLGDFA